MTIDKVRRWRDAFVIALFLILIMAPAVVKILDIDPSASLAENRRLASAPGFSSELKAVRSEPLEPAVWVELAKAVYAYPKAFEYYFNDRFGLRDLLIRAQSYTMLKGFPARSEVIVGKDDWLFFGHERVLATYRKTDPFPAAELPLWKRSLETQAQWLQDQGIIHLIVIAPEKSTIYPEFMPDNISVPGDRSRTDELLQALSQESDVAILDLRPILLDAKAGGELLYRKNDSHWNDLGALIASQAIIEQLAQHYPSLAPLSRSDFERVDRTAGGDLTRLLALDGIITEEVPYLVPLAERRAQPADPGIGPLPETDQWAQPFSTEIDDPSLPTAVVFRDSFGSALTSFMSESFERITYMHLEHLDREASIIQQELPDIVIYEMSERRFYEAIRFDDHLD